MAKIKLKPGVHMVTLKGGQKRKVRVKPNGQWVFLKMGKGGGGGTKAKSTGSTGGGNPAAEPTEAAPAKPPRIGKIYQDTKQGLQILVPVTDKLTRAVITRDLEGSLRLGGTQARARTGDVLGHEVITGLDIVIDRSQKVQQAAAISRRSATAILPEVYAGIRSVQRGVVKGQSPSLNTRNLHAEASRIQTGFDPRTHIQDLTDTDFLIYRKGKHFGQLLRLLRGRSKGVKRMTEPLAKMLKLVGAKI